MNIYFNPDAYNPYTNGQYPAFQASNNASSSSSSSIPVPSPQSAALRADQIGKENFSGPANTQIPSVNLNSGMPSIQTSNNIKKKKKAKATARKTQQATRSVLPEKERKKPNFAIPSKDEIETLYHMNLEEAAAALNISHTKLKFLCRGYGINKWPYRSIRKQQSREKIEKIRKQHSIDQYPKSLISPNTTQPSSSGSNEDLVYVEDNRTLMVDSEGSYVNDFNSYAEEPVHSFQPIEEGSQEFLCSYVRDFPMPPLTFSPLPSISQLNLSPLRPSNDKPLTGDAILRMAKQALNNSNSSLNG